MGGLRTEIPFTFWMMTIGTLALTGVGIPLTTIGFAGYVSKDAIIEATWASHSYGALYAFICVVIAAGFTSFYSWRLVFMTFFGERGQRESWMEEAHADAHGAHAADDHGHGHDDHGHAAHESPPVMLVPLAVLALGAAFAGVVFRSWFIGGGAEGFWRHALYLGHGEDEHPRGDGACSRARVAFPDDRDADRPGGRLLPIHLAARGAARTRAHVP